MLASKVSLDISMCACNVVWYNDIGDGRFDSIHEVQTEILAKSIQNLGGNVHWRHPIFHVTGTLLILWYHIYIVCIDTLRVAMQISSVWYMGSSR